ncbi:MAG TPA: NAD-dependent epimerase/dehydratase family protein [Nitrospirota bacterium]
MQTILGAGGTIATELAKALPRYTKQIRLVSRHPKKTNPTDEVMTADLLNGGQVLKAVQGSEIVYLAAGLRYDIKVWQSQWPVIMKNVLDACITHNAKLVFFDNVYPYGRVDGWMTEETPMNPSSEKGEVRKKLDEMILAEIKSGKLKAVIARAADFYGPDTPYSFVNAMVFEKFRKRKKAQWFVNDKVKHSFTYTPDAGKATAILGNTESAYNQVWHLPTDRNALTGKEFIEKAAEEFGLTPRYMIFSPWMLQVMGLFAGVIRESVEMLYQSDSDYLFDSSKFEKAFNFKPTPYSQGIRDTAKSLR